MGVRGVQYILKENRFQKILLTISVVCNRREGVFNMNKRYYHRRYLYHRGFQNIMIPKCCLNNYTPYSCTEEKYEVLSIGNSALVSLQHEDLLYHMSS